VLLRSPQGVPLGTLCHFDFVPCDVPVSELPLMEAAATLLARSALSARPETPAPPSID
jgi:hypothetical protein